MQLSSLTELHLSHNKLAGPLTDFTPLSALKNLDLSNNKFCDGPAGLGWNFRSLPRLSILNIENNNFQRFVFFAEEKVE